MAVAHAPGAWRDLSNRFHCSGLVRPWKEAQGLRPCPTNLARPLDMAEPAAVLRRSAGESRLLRQPPQPGNPKGPLKVRSTSGRDKPGACRLNQIQLNGFDLAIFFIYLLAAVGVGFLVSIGRKKTTRGYFLGGRTLPWYVIA